MKKPAVCSLITFTALTILCTPLYLFALDLRNPHHVDFIDKIGMGITSADGFIVNKFGANFDIDSAAIESVWVTGGLYPWNEWDGGPIQLDVQSNNVADDAGGTGALTLLLDGLDANSDIYRETITLDGTTSVRSTGTFTRLHRGRVLSAGSTGSNVGTLTVTAVGSGTTMMTIRPIENQSLMGIYTIPAGHIGCGNRLEFTVDSSSGANITGEIFVRPPGEVFQLKVFDFIRGSVGVYQRQQDCFALPAGTDIDARAESSSNNAVVTGAFDIRVYALK